MTAPHPAPEILARPATEDEIVTAAARVIKLAEAHGWQTRAEFGRGTAVGAGGKPTKLEEWLVVFCARPPERIAAMWRDGAYLSAVTPALERLNSNQLKERLAVVCDV